MEYIILKKLHPQISHVILNRPAKKNALNTVLLKEFLKTIELQNLDPHLRAIIISGAGNNFCSGLDLKELVQKDLTYSSAKLVNNLLQTIHFSPHVTIAAIEGTALAGGCGIMCACDLAIAKEGTILGFPEVHRGLVPALVSVLLSKQVSSKFLNELVLLGDLINADKALSMGLINKVTSQDVIKEALVYANKILTTGQNAIKESKKLLHKFSKNLQTDFESALKSHHEIRTSSEAEEGLNAFLNKRKPNWIKNEII